MKLQVPAQHVAEPGVKPVVEPSIPLPKADPLREAREAVEAIRQDSQLESQAFLNAIRSVLGAE